MTELTISNSGRSSFRDCRKYWDYSSRHRQGWDHIPSTWELDFGVALHAGMEKVYDPTTWNFPIEIRFAAAEKAYIEAMNDWRSRLKAIDMFYGSIEEKWEELKPLGRKMIKGYRFYSEDNDKHWSPIFVEKQFSVPIPVPENFGFLPDGFTTKWNDDLEEEVLYRYVDRDGIPCPVLCSADALPVMYEGRLDALMLNLETNRYWIWDHKSSSTSPDPTNHLELDPQGGGYYWACKRILGLDVTGICYNYMLRSVPNPPEILKSGKLSKSNSQKTTRDLYWQAISDLNLNPTEYMEFLNGYEEPKFFKRFETDRNVDELDQIGLFILHESIDMLNDPGIYPNPAAFRCNRCAFNVACRMSLEAGDDQFFLTHNPMYHKR